MTSLIAWIGVDSRGPASFYLASDSRISWPNSGAWDFGRKLFASSTYPDILGYYGDSFFTSQVLGQIIDLIDAGSLFEADAPPKSKFGAISRAFQQAHSTYPGQGTFSILHGSRRGEGMSASFALFELSWTQAERWQSKVIPVPSEKSSVVAVRGSGKPSISTAVTRWEQSEVGRTSRSAFSAFCDSLTSGADPASGGAPQLVGIYGRGAAETLGVINKKRRYLHGLNVDESPSLDGVEWRNELFERCDWKSGERLQKAQRHPRPRRL